MSDNNKNFITLIPGFLQGITRVTISYPFDYIRIYLQKNQFKNSLDVLKNENYNILKLYRGIKYPLSITPIDRAISFKLYEDFNKNYNPLFSSFIVSSITCIYNVPLQSINTNYILQKREKKYFSFIKEMINNYRTNYIFKSYFIEYSRLVLGSTLYMGIYGNLRKNIPNKMHYHMMNGIITNLISWSILYPLDTLRVEHSTNNKTLIKTVIDKYKTQGLFSFYKGIGLVYIRTIPSASIGMLVYEMVRQKIDKK